MHTLLFALVLCATPSDAPPRMPFEPFRFEPFVLGPPAGAQPGGNPQTVDLAEDLAREAYLGGSGVAGPLALLGTTINLFVEPALGAVASLAAHEDIRSRSGSVTRSTASAYGKTLTYMALFVGMWVLSVPVWAVLVGGVPAAVALGVAAANNFSTPGLVTAMGAGVVLAGAGATVLFAMLGVPWFVGRFAGVHVGDLVWDKLTQDLGETGSRQSAQSDLQGLLAKKPVGLLPSVRGGVMMASVAGGIWERNLEWDGLPVVGPFVTAALASRAMVGRLKDARRLVGEPAPPEHLTFTAPAVMFVRSGFLSAAQAGMILAGVLAATTGAVALTAALVPGAGVGVALPVLGVGLASAAAVAVVALVCGGVGTLMNAMVPWVLVALASSGGSNPQP